MSISDDEVESSSPDNQIRFRVDSALFDKVQRRTSRGRGGYGITARRDLARYYTILEKNLPKFRQNEAGLILEVLLQERVEVEYSHLLWAVIDDAIQARELDQRWNVDGLALVARIRALNPIEKLALIDAGDEARTIYYEYPPPLPEKERREKIFSIVQRLNLVNHSY